MPRLWKRLLLKYVPYWLVTMLGAAIAWKYEMFMRCLQCFSMAKDNGLCETGGRVPGNPLKPRQRSRQASDSSKASSDHHNEVLCPLRPRRSQFSDASFSYTHITNIYPSWSNKYLPNKFLPHTYNALLACVDKILQEPLWPCPAAEAQTKVFSQFEWIQSF